MNLNEAIENSLPKLEKLFTKKQLTEFKNTPTNELHRFHFGVGVWIRTNMIYPENSLLRPLFTESGVVHPDDMAAIVISRLHSYIISRPD